MTTSLSIQSTNPTAEQENRTRGFTLTEIAIVLGIIGLILGAVWTAAKAVYANQNASAFTNSMALYISAVRGACGSGSCATVPTVTTSIPTVANSQTGGTNPTAAILATGSIELAYTNVATTTTAGVTLCNGLGAAANATTSSLSVTSGGAPACTVACTVGKYVAPAAQAGYNTVLGSGVVVGAACAAAGACSYVYNGVCNTSLYFDFAPTF